MQSGYPKRKAMLLQLSTATGAMIGTMCGLLADSLSSVATMWILPFTAGRFIYRVPHKKIVCDTFQLSQ